MSRKELTERQIAVLNATFLGCLSTLRQKDGFVSTNPVSFHWTGEEVEISTLKNRMKYKNLVADSRATFCVIDPANHMNYVELRGSVRFVDDPGGAMMRERFYALTGEYPPDDLDPEGAERVMIYLLPEQVSSPVLYAGRLDDYADSGTQR
ncbi:MAG: pyridoxamine 5'-phosphate oxidase family protein [Pseudomonadota bacterium]